MLLPRGKGSPRRPHYDYGRAFHKAVTAVCGLQLAEYLSEDLSLLRDVGLERLGRTRLNVCARNCSIDYDAASKVLGFRNVEYRFEGNVSATF